MSSCLFVREYLAKEGWQLQAERLLMSKIFIDLKGEEIHDNENERYDETEKRSEGFYPG
jgi:tRNA A22 N-methylase